MIESRCHIEKKIAITTQDLSEYFHVIALAIEKYT